MNNYLFTEPGDGLMLSQDGLTTKWLANDAIKKTSDGIAVDVTMIANGIRSKIDGHTVIMTGLTKDRRGILSINRDVVSCCFSMCMYEVTGRETADTYSVNTSSPKDITAIRNEFNIVKNTYASLGKVIPMGIPLVPTKVYTGDFITLRTGFRGFLYSDENGTWPIAADDMRRYETDEICAMFYVSEATWNDSEELTQLSLFCIWSSMPSFKQGLYYGSPSTPSQIITV